MRPALSGSMAIFVLLSRRWRRGIWMAATQCVVSLASGVRLWGRAALVLQLQDPRFLSIVSCRAVGGVGQVFLRAAVVSFR
jgi:hypothetical protein